MTLFLFIRIGFLFGMIWRIVQLLGPRIALKLKLILMNKKENRPTFMTAESFTNGDRFLFITLKSSCRPRSVSKSLLVVVRQLIEIQEIGLRRRLRRRTGALNDFWALNGICDRNRRQGINVRCFPIPKM